ncbi:MAG: hypothetical protein SGCHY_000129 [Lobulomycetales sp.]
MKVKVISRAQDLYGQKKRRNDLPTTVRNLDPVLHPFQRVCLPLPLTPAQAREYTRALNSVKMERLFAKPFLHALSGHIDGVYALARHPTDISCLVSGSGDGYTSRLAVYNSIGKSVCGICRPSPPRGLPRGICAVPFGDAFFSVGQDKTVKCWKQSVASTPVSTYTGDHAFQAIDHHRSKPWFVTASARGVDLWDHSRAQAIQQLEWGSDTITSVKMNQTETSILASCGGSDRTVLLYDLRTALPVQKTVLAMRSNAIAWNPMEAFNFTVANEDHNCYTFDMRNMARSINVLKDHVSAVLDLEYSPTGEEIVTGGYDKTLRIFKAREGHSRDVYHTKRMQKIWCVRYTMDGSRVLSASDDGNIRVWKNNSHDKLATSSRREVAARNYQEKLKDRFKHMPEIARIDKHRKVPKGIKKAGKTKAIQNASAKRKQENVIKHSKPGSVARKSEREKHILGTEQ